MADLVVSVREPAAGAETEYIDNETAVNGAAPGGVAARQRVAAFASGATRQKKHIEFIPSSAAPTTIYTGFAPVGSADSAAVWTIQRFVFTGVTAIDETWSGVGVAWSDRASTSYS